MRPSTIFLVVVSMTLLSLSMAQNIGSGINSVISDITSVGGDITSFAGGGESRLSAFPEVGAHTLPEVASTVTSGAVLGYSYVTSEGRQIVTTVTSGAAGAFETVTSGGSRYFGTVTSGAEGAFSTATSGAASVATVVTSGAGGAATTITSAVRTDGAAALMPFGSGQSLGLIALVLAGVAGMGAVAL